MDNIDIIHVMHTAATDDIHPPSQLQLIYQHSSFIITVINDWNMWQEEHYRQYFIKLFLNVSNN